MKLEDEAKMKLHAALADLELIAGIKSDGHVLAKQQQPQEPKISPTGDGVRQGAAAAAAELDMLDHAALSPRDLAPHFAPALYRLQGSQEELARIAQAGTGGASAVAWGILELGKHRSADIGIESMNENDTSFVDIPAKVGTRLGDFCTTSKVERQEPDFDYGTIRSSLDACQEPVEYAEAVRTVLAQPLVVPMWWVFQQNPRNNQPATKKDETHQDTRDVERDTVIINGQSMRGVQVKYQGVVDSLVHVLQEAEKWITSDSTSCNEERHKSALNRFARAILNTGNRTNSGGNAYESIMLLVGGSPHALVTPDSDEAEPICIDISLDNFFRGSVSNSRPGSDDVAIRHQEWGLVAKISGITKYLLKDPEDVENSIGGVVGEFTQTLAMTWPPPRFESHLCCDDRNNMANKADYRVFESSQAFMDGQVHVSDWPRWAGLDSTI